MFYAVNVTLDKDVQSKQRIVNPVSHQGRLAGVGGEDLPTIVLVAHYDSFGVAPVSCFISPTLIYWLINVGSEDSSAEA